MDTIAVLIPCYNAVSYTHLEYSVLAAALCASLPAIMNMGISAKPDIITWLLQLIMIEYFFRYLISTGAGEDRNGKGSGRGNVTLLILSAGAYLLSLTMKPTSLIFSTAVFLSLIHI